MLKLLAILIMTVDHADRILLDRLSSDYHVLTVIGRFAFPIFAFMIARNSLYTSNPRQYVKLLLIFGVVSQPIYWWALGHESFWDPLNVLFTLALGVLCVRAWLAGPRYWLALPVLIGLGWFVEYRMEGVALMLMIGMTVHNIRHRGVLHPYVITGAVVMAGLAYFLNFTSYNPQSVLYNEYAKWVMLALALCFMTLHPKMEALESRFRFTGGKLFFYAYYPGHLAVLGLLALLLFGTAAAY
ncbi:MAG: hypothetical protein CMN28_00275 [Salinisphaeraceae bacterium]|jgi:hypothetical protein|nr:hypothetical protein [Salinisphaeraceae bacterium]